MEYIANMLISATKKEQWEIKLDIKGKSVNSLVLYNKVNREEGQSILRQERRCILLVTVRSLSTQRGREQNELVFELFVF